MDEKVWKLLITDKVKEVLLITERVKEVNNEATASCSYLDDEFKKCSIKEGVDLATSVEREKHSWEQKRKREGIACFRRLTGVLERGCC